MVRNYIVKLACVLMLIGLTTGFLGQIELLNPGILFLSLDSWSTLLGIHAWVTSIALVVICLSTISIIAHRAAAARWAVWIGFAVIPFLVGVISSVMLKNAKAPDSYLFDTVYTTASQHAYGVAALSVALGGLSALATVKSKTLPSKVSFVFALLIAGSGVILTILQVSLGLNGLPRRYLDYPQEFAQLQFYSGVAAIASLIFSAIYIILLWRCSNEDIGKAEEIF